MKRFFCTKCNRVKRVRSLPTILENKELLDPSLRLGQCNSHYTIKVLKQKISKISIPETVAVMYRRKR